MTSLESWKVVWPARERECLVDLIVVKNATCIYRGCLCDDIELYASRGASSELSVHARWDARVLQPPGWRVPALVDTTG